MIYFEFYSFIIPKMILEFKYPGGIKQFRLDVTNQSYSEDDHLASARFLRINEIDQFLNLVKDKGLHYDSHQNYSKDFAVMGWIGPWWEADWLHSDTSTCSMKGSD